MLVQCDDLTREMSLRGGAQLGELAVGAGPYPSEMNIAPALARFIDACPGVRVHVMVKRSRRSVAQLHQRDIDLLVGELSDLREMTDLIQEPLQPHQVYFVTRSSHPLTHRPAVQLTDVLGYPLVISQLLPDRVAHPLHEARGATHRAVGAMPAIQTDSTALMRAIVAASNAVGVFTLTMIAGDLRRGELAVLPVVPPWLCTQFGIVRLAKRTPSPPAEQFMQLVRVADEELTQQETELRRELFVPHRKRRQRTRKRDARVQAQRKDDRDKHQAGGKQKLGTAHDAHHA